MTLRKHRNPVYVPEMAIREVRDIMEEEGLFSQSESFKRSAYYSLIGRKAMQLKLIPMDKLEPFITRKGKRYWERE
jgi:hypothetical protein